MRSILRIVGTLRGHHVAGPAVIELARQAGAQVIGQRLLVRRPSLSDQAGQAEPDRPDRPQCESACDVELSWRCSWVETGPAAVARGPPRARRVPRRLIGSLTFFQREIDRRSSESQETCGCGVFSRHPPRATGYPSRGGWGQAGSAGAAPRIALAQLSRSETSSTRAQWSRYSWFSESA